MDLIIGAPVHQRAWVLPDWFERLAKQELPWEWEGVEVVFNYGRSSDSTLEVIEEAREWLPWTITVLEDPEDDHHGGKRNWDMARYETMARLRNRLLEYVREQRPTYYMSLDTDILLPDGAIRTLIQDFEEDERHFDVVGPTLYMTKRSTSFPNAMRLDSGRRYREQYPVTRYVDVVFAAVLMAPSAYEAVDYVAHRRGEDIGWGHNAHAVGLRMGLNPHVVCKHVMEPWMLEEVDPRVGW